MMWVVTIPGITGSSKESGCGPPVLAVTGKCEYNMVICLSYDYKSFP